MGCILLDPKQKNATIKNIELLGRFENIAISNIPPPIESTKMSPVLSLGSDLFSVFGEIVDGVGKRNLDFN